VCVKDNEKGWGGWGGGVQMKGGVDAKWGQNSKGELICSFLVGPQRLRPWLGQ
jgi:hypothetical protein